MVNNRPYMLRKPQSTVESQAWLLTFSDLLLLLLTIFVLKLSMTSLSMSSIAQATRLLDAQQAQKRQNLSTVPRPWSSDPNLTSATKISVDSFVDSIAAAQGGLQVEVGLPAHLRVRSSPSVSYDGETLTVWFSRGVFADNSSELTFEGQEILRTIARAAAFTGFSARISAYEPATSSSKIDNDNPLLDQWSVAKGRLKLRAMSVRIPLQAAIANIQR